MTYLGAYTVGSTVTHLFTSRGSTGVPTALVASSLTPSVYKDGGTLQESQFASLTTNFDSVAGLNMVVVDSTDSTPFYVKGSDYYIVLGTATVDAFAVTGEVVAAFSLNDGTLAANSITSSTFSTDALSEHSVVVGGMEAAVITAAAFAADSITSAKIADDALGPEHIADNALVSTSFAPSAYSEIAKSILTASLAGSGVPSATRNVANALRPLRNKVDLGAGSTMTVYAENDSTSGWTGSITTAATQGPLASIDPQG
jgi:hypothetical protein